MPLSLRVVPGLFALFVCGALFADEPITFEQHVRPILKAYCLDCHGGGETVKGNLDLRLKRFAEKGGDSGPAIVVGKPDESVLIERLKSGEMPPTEKKVPPQEIAVIERWIARGAATTRTEPESLPPGIDITPDERAYWFFQPLARPEPPAFTPADGVRTPVDAFVLAKLREKNLALNPEADRRTLIRRAYIDLIGLPPTAQEVDAFVADPDERAYEKLVDRLLDMPQYGERWARHWLDVAGYADSEGDGTTDTPRRFAWKYRDWVVRAFNANKPLDRFLIEQLAGDELIPRPVANLTPEQIELLTATGFLRMAADSTASGGDVEVNAHQVIADTLKIVSSSLLGLSVGCAQCHDHRYDPIPQSDYFRLRAVFEPAWNVAAWKRPEQRLVSLLSDGQKAEWSAFYEHEKARNAEIAAKEKEWIDKLFAQELEKFPEADRAMLKAAFETPADKRTPEQKKLVETTPKLNITPGVIYQYNQAAADEIKKMRDELAAQRAKLPPPDHAHALLEDPGVAIETKVHYRGDHRQPKQAVLPGDLTIAAPDGARFEIPTDDPSLPTTGRRLAYAKHLTSGQHPLVGRVLMNRVWLHHFGRGLVDTPGEFGILGVRPTHPELLDWLATELVQQKWSLKAMHRLLMTSTVYRQSSRREAGKDAVDSDNALYGRFPVRRLEAETLRDSVLAVSGRLDKTQFGPSIAVDEDFVGQVLPAGDSARRSLYLQVRRSKPVSFLAAFDAPLMAVNCDRRVLSTGAPQSLMLMNSEFIANHARILATKLRAETPSTPADPLMTSLEARFPRATAAWTYGFGHFDEATQRIASFTPVTHWTGSQWQAGPALPDPNAGWVLIRPTGGHAGNDPQHATIRRWTAPFTGVVKITGKLKHSNESGDGVRGRIVSNRAGLLGQWTAKNIEVASDLAEVNVTAGDTLDFAVDCLENVNCDSFEWPVQITAADPTAAGPIAAWDAAKDFHGPLPATLPQLTAAAWVAVYQRLIAPEELQLACEFLAGQLAHLRTNPMGGDLELAALTNLCHQLLNSNEFLYVD